MPVGLPAVHCRTLRLYFNHTIVARARKKLPYLLGALITSSMTRHAKICLRSKEGLGSTTAKNTSALSTQH